jgi:hypothetical protein
VLGCLAVAGCLRAGETAGGQAPAGEASAPEVGDAAFGILAFDAAGEPHFVQTDEVPNAPGQQFGWILYVGESAQAVRWTETLTLEAPAADWGEARPGLAVSPDGRSATVQEEAVPEGGWIESTWSVAAGDPPGACELVVALASGLERRFRFTLGAPGEAEASPWERALESCERIQADDALPISCEVREIEGVTSLVIAFPSRDEAARYWDDMAERIAEPFCEATGGGEQGGVVLLVVGESARPYDCEGDAWGPWLELEGPREESF